MSEWKIKLLSEVVKFNPENIGKNYPYEKIHYLDITAVGTGLVEYNEEILLSEAPSRAKRLVKEKDTIIATVRPVNKSYYYFKELPKNTIVSTGFAVIRAIEEIIDCRFLYYVISNNSFTSFLVANEQGANYPAVTPDIIGRAEIHLPPLLTQKRIASILSAYDDLIENNLKRIKLLEELSQRTYEEWFVKFRVNGKKLEVGENGLPEGWEKEKLVDIAEINNGFAFKANQFNSDGKGMPIIRIRNIPNSNTNDFTTEKVDNKFLVEKGDLLVGMDGEFHINNWSGPKAYLVQRSCNIKAIDIFYHGYLSQAIVKPIKFFEATISGATVAHLGKKHLDTIEIVIPPEEFNENIKQFNDWLDLKINLGYQNRLLKESQDILLPQLMSGKIDVSGAVAGMVAEASE